MALFDNTTQASGDTPSPSQASLATFSNGVVNYRAGGGFYVTPATLADLTAALAAALPEAQRQLLTDLVATGFDPSNLALAETEGASEW